jgi:hypothetical protein
MGKPKNSSLPFVVSPRLEPMEDTIGNPDYGEVKITRKGYLTVAEKAFVDSVLAGDSSISGLRRLAVEISRETGFSQSQVLNDISDMDNLKDYLVPYTSKIIGAVEEMSSFQQKRAIACTTGLMIHRVDKDWTIERTLNDLPFDILSDFSAFYDEEESRNLEYLEKKYAEKNSDPEVEQEGKE